MVLNLSMKTKRVNIRPLLFNKLINDILFLVEKPKICDFTDDNTIYTYGKDLYKIIEDLVNAMKNILKWFRLNSFKANPGKFQFIIHDDKTSHEYKKN